MEIIIHRGTKEIGGTCVELVISKKRLLLDIGLPLDYDEWTVEEREEYEKKMSGIIEKADAIFLSHYHQDHIGLLKLVNKSTPIYLSDPTIRAIRIPEMFFRDGFIELNFIPLYDKKEVNEIGGILITPYRVDHSAFGAMAFLIEDLELNKSLLYTGDIRLHGLSKTSYLSLKQNVDYLLLEGTNIGRYSEEGLMSEEKACENFIDIFQNHPNHLNYVWASALNIDRIKGLYDACKKTNKVLAVDFYTMNILKSMSKHHPDVPYGVSYPYIKCFCPQYLASYTINFKRRSYLINHLRDSKISKAEIKENPSKFVVMIRPRMIYDIKYIDAEKANYITSIWKEYEKDEKNKPFFDYIEKRGYNKFYNHTSGHAFVEGLEELNRFVNPKNIIPIHTQEANLYKNIFPSSSILNLNDGERHLLD